MSSEENKPCVCGGSTANPNADCERCQLLAKLAAETKRAELLLEANGRLQADLMVESSKQAMFELIDEHGDCNDDLWATLKERLAAAENELARRLRVVANEVHAIRRIGRSAGYMGFSGDWIADQCDGLLTLLAPAKEADDAPL